MGQIGSKKWCEPCPKLRGNFLDLCPIGRLQPPPDLLMHPGTVPDRAPAHTPLPDTGHARSDNGLSPCRLARLPCPGRARTAPAGPAWHTAYRRLPGHANPCGHGRRRKVHPGHTGRFQDRLLRRRQALELLLNQLSHVSGTPTVAVSRPRCSSQPAGPPAAPPAARDQPPW